MNRPTKKIYKANFPIINEEKKFLINHSRFKLKKNAKTKIFLSCFINKQYKTIQHNEAY